MNDLVDKINRYENGEMTEEEVIDFFTEIIKDGTIWHLQGSYARTAQDLIHQGLITGL